MVHWLPHARVHTQTGFWVAKRDWLGWKKPHVVLATEVAKRYSDARVTHYRVQRPYQVSR